MGCLLVSAIEENAGLGPVVIKPSIHSKKEEPMSTQSSVEFFHNWAKERLDEMDAIVTSLKSKTAELQAQSRVKADQFIVDLGKKRDEFERTVKKQAEAGEATWEKARAQLETQWNSFEAEVKKYLEAFGKDVKQQHAVFESQVKAQMKAWHETANKI